MTAAVLCGTPKKSADIAPYRKTVRLACVLALLCSVNTVSSSVVSLQSVRKRDSGNSEWTVDDLLDFHQLRTGSYSLKYKRQPFFHKILGRISNEAVCEKINTTPAVWHIQGTLTNPNTGRVIALIEGVELSQSLAFGSKTDSNNHTGEKSIIEGLAVGDIIKEGNWKAYSLSITHKFFALLDPEDRNPLYVFRHTKAGKRIPVQPFQAYGQVIMHLLRAPNHLIVCSERPGKQIILTEASARSNGSLYRNNKFAVNNKKGARIFNLSLFVSSRIAPHKQRGNRWIGFGPSPPPSIGCKESYDYVAQRVTDRQKDDAVFTFHRFGECPSWYAPGKMCSMDLQAKRIESFEELPSFLQNAIDRHVPTFRNLPRSGIEYQEMANKVTVTEPAPPLGDSWWQFWKKI